MKNTVYLIVAVFSLVMLTACSSTKTTQARQTAPIKYQIVSKAAPVPEGVVRYCWEEPMVDIQKYNPGLDSDGAWYHPAYHAVREVRQGRWRPCEAVESEVRDGS